MIVTIDEAVFGNPKTVLLDLMALMHLCRDDRHVLLCRPLYEPGASIAVDDWLKTLPLRLSKEAQTVLNRSAEEAAAARPVGTCSIRIRANHRSCRGPVPELDLGSAVRLLRVPLRLLVENSRNDAAFLRKMIPPAWRRSFDEALEAGWIEFEHGGGLPEMVEQVRAARELGVSGLPLDPHSVWLWRLWLLFDHDGQMADVPSKKSNVMERLCSGIKDPWPLSWHRLSRRSIENYLPLDSLKAWAGKNRGRLRKFHSYAAMDEVRSWNELTWSFDARIPHELQETWPS